MIIEPKMFFAKEILLFFILRRKFIQIQIPKRNKTIVIHKELGKSVFEATRKFSRLKKPSFWRAPETDFPSSLCIKVEKS